VQVSYDDRLLVRNGSEADRRSAVRYPIKFEVRYIQLGGQDKALVKGVGRSVNISSHGVLFVTGFTFEEGSTVELLIPWSASDLHGSAVELYLDARIVRSKNGQTAARIARHEFRTVPKDRGLRSYRRYLINDSSRQEFKTVPPTMAAAGASRSVISRLAIDASVEHLKQLQGRRWEDAEILMLYIDGQRVGDHHVLCVLGVDLEGRKHVMGIEVAAAEDASAGVKRLLTRLRDQGLPSDRKYLFVIDGTEGARVAIEELFGADQPVQRCRNDRLESVLKELPKSQHSQTSNWIRAAWRLRSADEGEQRLESLAQVLEADHPLAARNLREGMAELFTLQRLNIPENLHKCLATTNLIENPKSGVRRRTERVSRGLDAQIEPWVASGLLFREEHFRRIDGHAHLRAVAAILGRTDKCCIQGS